MSKMPNFANREVADLLISNYEDGKMFLFVDWANVSSTSFEAERVFAIGGQGAPNRVQFDGERTGTLTVEAQVYPAKVFQMLSGNDLLETVNILKREILTATDTGLTLSASPATSSVQVFTSDDDCGTQLDVTVTDTAVTGDDIVTDSKYIVYYYSAATDSTIIHFDTSHFPKAYRVEGSVPFKTEADEILESRHIWYKVAPQASFELSWQNTGDPASITLNFDVMADADDNIYDMVFPNSASN